jgi:hypothetical protein
VPRPGPISIIEFDDVDLIEFDILIKRFLSKIKF